MIYFSCLQSNIFKNIIFLLMFFSGYNAFTQSLCGFSVSKDSVEFDNNGGTNSTIRINNFTCSDQSFGLLGVPDWLSGTKVDGDAIIVKCAPHSGPSRDATIAVTHNGGVGSSFRVYQNTSVTPPPPPPPPTKCQITGFAGHSFGIDGGLVSYPVSFSNCNANSASFSFKNGLGGSLPDWFSISSNITGTAIAVNCKTNYNSEKRFATVLVTANNGINDIETFQAVIEQGTCLAKFYPDSDNDGLGDCDADFVKFCIGSEPSRWVNNNDDFCPLDPNSNSTGCKDNIITDDMNWVNTVTKDRNGRVISDSYSYYDELGKNIQSRSVDMKTKKVWYNNTFYDIQGRPALSTLSAPSGISGFYKNGTSANDVGYNPEFVKNSNNAIYGSSDFEKTDIENPTPTNDENNTLGWYYSNNNNDEGYQDKTNRPYSRTIYSELNPGAVLKTIGGNQIDGEWKQGYSFTMPASQELAQSGAFGQAKYNNYKVLKTIVRDVHGIESVVFTDTDGNTLAAARSGNQEKANLPSREMEIAIGVQGYVDIHIPVGCSGITVSGSGAASTIVHDLITEQPVTIAKNVLPAGFYRISVPNPDGYVADAITVNYKENYYDYSLNEYDKAGRLLSSKQPLNKLETTYKYNTLGQLTYTSSPDEGKAWFLYRKDGQIRFSVNTKQLKAKQFSYTNYDQRGRPVESGVYTDTNQTYLNSYSDALTNPFKAALLTLVDRADGDGLTDSNCSEVQKTTYDAITDASSLPSAYRTPSFLAGNVAKTWNENTTTWYSYDIYGRVKWIVQNITGLGFKTIDYTYDPVSSQVTQVDYQKNTASERFIHKYSYDPDDYSLVKVETSTNGTTFEEHAAYEYYETGALKRLNLAQGLQGIDYVYNLQGALKSINHPSLTAADDPGGDNDDVFGMNIHYYKDDYARTNTPKPVPTITEGIDQYNGNIKAITWNIRNQNGTVPDSYYYKYNRNNWLEGASFNDPIGGAGDINAFETRNTAITSSQTVEATQGVTLLPGFHFSSNSTRNFTAKINTAETIDASGAYNVSGITYDANGNIQTLTRNKNGVNGNTAMDKLSYIYDSNKPNQLRRVEDDITQETNVDDIKGQLGLNYKYNDIGQLIENVGEGIKYTYTASGLVSSIRRNNKWLLRFDYNDKGHRVRKVVYNPEAGTHGQYDHEIFYVRDAAGTPLGIYRKDASGIVVQEHTVYGASRLGVYKRAANKTTYELTDHLGNVRALVEKGSTQPKGATDYYPFGMVMPDRNLTTNQYRYGYQGQEVDTETGKPAFQLRLWDARIGRWLSTDPKGEFSSPYLGMGNNPIVKIDPDGGNTKGYNDWVEKADGTIYWDNNATSQATTKAGETYLGKNVLVATHNRDTKGNEAINTAQFDLYLASNKAGPTATIMGNTVPSDITKSGTLAEGLYSAKFGHRNKKKYHNELAIRIYNLNGSDGLPTLNGNPSKANSNLLTGVLFHMGNNYQTSLFDSKGNAYSHGCQTSGCFPNSRSVHNAFMNKVGKNFIGTYYLRAKPVLAAPAIVPFTSQISGFKI